MIWSIFWKQITRIKWQTLNHIFIGTRKLCWESDRQQKKSSIEDLKRCAIKWFNQCSGSFNVRGKYATDEKYSVHTNSMVLQTSPARNVHNSLYSTIENVYQLFVVVAFSWAWNSYTHTHMHGHGHGQIHTRSRQTNNSKN